jgi:hypothetical protein
MPQAPTVIQNVQMPAARTAVNAAYEAIITRQSGPTQPSTTYAFMEWVDISTSPATKRVRNSANNAWVVVGTMDTVREGNAPLAAPTFTGLAQCANTAGATANDSQIANTAHVKLALANHGAWQSPSLQNGWTASTVIQYRLNSDGMLQIKGSAVNTGTVGTSSQIFVLPVGFRPVQTHQPKIRYFGTTVYVLQIQSDGQVLHTAGGSLTNAFQDFDIIIPLN